MIAWWEKLSERERLLVAAAAGLLGIILMLQLVLMPLLASRSAARLKADQAARTLDLMTSRGFANTEAGAGPIGQPLDTDARRRAVLDSAARRGLAIARVQVGEDGTVTVQVDDSSPDIIFAWLLDVKRNAGLEASKVAMNETGAGQVRSSFEFGSTSGR
ncbi:type II secretion system protein GspM [Hyphomonas johnsonii]|jgi:type II secretory pathway component PulM|uniref:General secretion pathway M protein n=1 Tax=Hyphomonas johnsonii MHS-2 TaxID=1280950 RepID=A0A059FUE2_9PROT|nr:type II secretion system protein GspM [Hyphomonas johnsonii]KCZ94299.1 general secretion pathway M protein [Hyphomonas johnsonii MHS-2]